MNDNFNETPQEQGNVEEVQSAQSTDTQQIPYYAPQYNALANNLGASTALNVVSLVAGIISIVCCCFWYLSIIASIVGLITGIIGAVKAGKDGKKGMAIAGIILSAIGLLMIVGILIFGAAIATSPEFASALDPLFEEAYGMSFEEYMQTYGAILR